MRMLLVSVVLMGGLSLALGFALADTARLKKHVEPRAVDVQFLGRDGGGPEALVLPNDLVARQVRAFQGAFATQPRESIEGLANLRHELATKALIDRLARGVPPQLHRPLLAAIRDCGTPGGPAWLDDYARQCADPALRALALAILAEAAEPK